MKINFDLEMENENNPPTRVTIWPMTKEAKLMKTSVYI